MSGIVSVSNITNSHLVRTMAYYDIDHHHLFYLDNSEAGQPGIKLSGFSYESQTHQPTGAYFSDIHHFYYQALN